MTSFVRKIGLLLLVAAGDFAPPRGDEAKLGADSFSLSRLGSVILQLRQVSAIADVVGGAVDPWFAGPPRYPGPIPIPPAVAGREELVSTGLLGDGGGVSIGEDRLDEDAEDELALPAW